MDAPSYSTKEEIAEAIRKHDGNLSAVAKELGVRRKNLQERISAHSDLKAVLDDVRDEIIDHAEDNVFSDVRKGDPSASRFVLATLGKNRGWTQRVESTGADGAALEVTVKKFTQEPENGGTGTGNE